MLEIAKAWEDLESDLYKLVGEKIAKFQQDNDVIIKSVDISLCKYYLGYAGIADIKVSLDFEETMKKYLMMHRQGYKKDVSV